MWAGGLENAFGRDSLVQLTKVHCVCLHVSLAEILFALCRLIWAGRPVFSQCSCIILHGHMVYTLLAKVLFYVLLLQGLNQACILVAYTNISKRKLCMKAIAKSKPVVSLLVKRTRKLLSQNWSPRGQVEPNKVIQIPSKSICLKALMFKVL